MTAIADEPETDGDAPEDEAQPAAPKGDPSGQKPGWWLEADPKDVKKGVLQLVKSQDGYRKFRSKYEECCERLRAGERGLTVERSRRQDDEWYVREGLESTQGSGPNIAHQLIQRTAATLTTDPPLPTVSANSDDQAEREASELAERILQVEGSASERDDAGFTADVIDKAGTYGTMYALFCVDPQGGGLQAVQIQAHPAATTTDDALTPMGPPSIDPMTGQALPGQPIEVRPEDLQWRYVAVADETGVQRLTDVEAEAQRVWQPKVMRHLVPPAAVALFPFGATVDTATGVAVGRWVSLAEIVSRFYDGVRPSEDVCKKLASWKGDGLDIQSWALPTIREHLPAQPPTYPSGAGPASRIMDDALCPLLTLYLQSQPTAPFGAYVAIGGLEEPIYRGEWRKTIGDGPDARVEAFPLPVAAFTCWGDPGGDPNGIPFIEALAAESNLDATLTDFVLNYVWRASNPHIWSPVGTTVQKQAFLARTGEPLQIEVPGTQPFFEEIPPMDRAVFEVQKETRAGLQRSSGLSATIATGDQDGSVTSGLQQRMVAEETRVGLSTPAKNRDRFLLRCWNVLLVLIRAHYDTPRMLDYTDEDSGETQAQAFTGVQLMGAGDIAIAKGTGTLLNPTAKTELARDAMDIAQKAGDPEAMAKWHDQLIGNQGPLVGLKGDPARARIASQINQIKQLAKQPDLPPPVPEPPPQLDPMGQPIPQPPMDPVRAQAAAIFAPNPADPMPGVALTRYRALRDLIQSKTYERADPRIQEAITAAFETARRDTGVTTVAEAQAAQQAAATAQQNAKIAEIDAKKSKDPLPGIPGTADTGPEAAPAQNGPQLPQAA